jgi:site-specific recombinase XerD
VTALAPVLQGFFRERLAALRASEHTVAAYRDTYKLLLLFCQEQLRTPPSRLDLSQLDAPTITAFLQYLETDRGNGVATRNLRLTAIHSLFRYAALRCPEHADTITRVLAIPNARPQRPLVTFLTRPEQHALLAAPDRSTWHGRRDHLILTVMLEAGLRVSELSALTIGDAITGTGAHLRCLGKGRRERCTPLTRSTSRLLESWLREQRPCLPEMPLFPTRKGGSLSRDAVTDLVSKHVAEAAKDCGSLAVKHVSPHTLRHSCAMDLLQAGADTASIALWLGHSDSRSTQAYLHADMTQKRRTLELGAPTPQAAKPFKPSDRLLRFLEEL